MMPNCSPTTIAMERPTQQSVRNAGTTINCGNNSTRCCNVNVIGPRKNREKVREDIRDFVLQMLGAPVISIELTEQMINTAIDRAFRIFEDYAPREFYDYYTFATTPGKSVYELPPQVGLIRNVFYKEQPINTSFTSDVGGVVPVDYFQGGSFGDFGGGMSSPTQPVWGQMGSFTLYNQYTQMYNRMSSNVGGWEWVGGYRHIKLYPIPCGTFPVMVHYLQKCKDWECVSQALEDGALAHAKIMIGRIRSKYTNIPGPGGGVQLDGNILLQEGNQDLVNWQQSLLDRYGDLGFITMD